MYKYLNGKNTVKLIAEKKKKKGCSKTFETAPFLYNTA